MASSVLNGAVDGSFEEFTDFESAKVETDYKESIEDEIKVSSSELSSDKIKCTGAISKNKSVNVFESSHSASLFNIDVQTKCNISQVLKSTFPCSQNEEKSPKQINDLEDQCISQQLWSKLQDVNHIPEPHWEDSQAFQLMLRSLKIDSRNILQTSVAPIISHLEMINPLLFRPCFEEPFEDVAKDIDLSIPEVQFEWTCSGLINPLEDEICLMDIIDSEDELNSKLNEKESLYLRKFANVNFECRKEEIDLFPDLSFMQAKSLIVPCRKVLSQEPRIL